MENIGQDQKRSYKRLVNTEPSCTFCFMQLFLDIFSAEKLEESLKQEYRMRVPTLDRSCFLSRLNLKIRISLKVPSPKRGIILAKINLKLSPLFVLISLFYSEQVYMFSNGRDRTKCHSFCTLTTSTMTTTTTPRL